MKKNLPVTEATVLFVALAVISACLPAQTIEIRRSALVPAATPINRSGANMGNNLIEANVGGELATADPSANDNSSGVVIPHSQLRGGLRFRPPHLDNIDFGLSYMRLHSNGATSIADQPVPNDDGAAYLATVHARLPVGDEGLFVGIASEVSLYSLPYLIYERCINNCNGEPFSSVNEYRSLVPGFGMGLNPNYQVGRFTLYGQMTVRTHPNIARLDTVTTDTLVDPGGPSMGPLVLIVGAGIEAALPKGVRLGIRSHMVAGGPVAYKPAVSAMLTIPLVRQEPSKASL